MICESCPRKCCINRDKQVGFCGVKNILKLAKVGKFDWEEPCISGINGSGAIFFSGCNLKCVFCQNYEISSCGVGKEITINRLVEIFKELEKLNVHNINLVSPTQFSMQIIEALKQYKPKIPVVWNSNGFENEDIIKKLKDYVDIFVVDMKFMDKNLSKKYCFAENYFEVNKQCVKLMLKQQPKLVFENEILKKGVIIRHLIMPHCVQDSLNILQYIKDNFSKYDFLLSLMGQYTPYYKAKEDNLINRKLKPLEYKIVVNKAIELGLTKGYIQDLDSSGETYIPNFDLSGV